MSSEDIYTPSKNDSKKYENFKPTRLYIKQHKITKKLYFGKSTIDNISSYTGSGTYWIRHIKKHGIHHVVTLWVSDWYYDPKSLEEVALHFSKENDIVNSDKWANLTPEDGLLGGKITYKVKELQSISRRETINSPEWKNTIGEKAKEKRKETISNEEWKSTIKVEWLQKIRNTKLNHNWKETKGKEAIQKYIDTVSNPVWKETIGKERIRKGLETKSSTEWQNSIGVEWKNKIRNIRLEKDWKETVGNAAIEKYKDTISDDEWKGTTGTEMRKNMSDIRKTKEYKERNLVTCPHCERIINGRGNLKRHINANHI